MVLEISVAAVDGVADGANDDADDDVGLRSHEKYYGSAVAVYVGYVQPKMSKSDLHKGP